MNRISPELLRDTLSLVALARETALGRGSQAQAARLEPVVESLRGLVTASHEAPAAGILGQDDFQALLSAGQGGGQAASMADRGQIAAAMAAGGMPETEIARHLGVSRDEVRLILQFARCRKGEEAQE